MNDTLFELPESVPPPAIRAELTSKPRPRILKANRSQLEWRTMDLDALLPEDHRARLVWAFVERMDLKAVHDSIKAVDGAPGRPVIDPRILASLWLYATLEGVGSARAVERLTQAHVAYRWICGGVHVNHHTLADFRTQRVEMVDQWLTNTVASLLSTGHVEMKRVAQDGMRVRAAAGAASFRRRPRLEALLREADEQVQTLKKEVESDPSGTERRQRATAQRVAEDRLRRLQDAVEQMAEIEEHRANQAHRNRSCDSSPQVSDEAGSGPKCAEIRDDSAVDPPSSLEPRNGEESKGGDPGSVQSSTDAEQKPSKTSKKAKQPAKKIQEPRVSTTDPECRVMKMPGGGAAPALNVQLVTDTATQVIVGLDVTPRGNDYGEMGSMQGQLFQRYGKTPQEYLVDGGFASFQDIENTTSAGSLVYAPVPKSGRSKTGTQASWRKDTKVIAAWRERMATAEGQEIYKERGATAECVNALARQRGLQQFRVRGRLKAFAVVLWYVLAHNLMRIATLGFAA